MRLPPVLLAVALTAAVGPRALAGPAFDQALAAYDRVEYAQAARAFELALAGEALGKAELERAYYLLGSSLLADGQTERAAGAFRTLFAIRPDFRPEADASPKVRELMARVHKERPSVEARLAPLPPPRGAGTGPLDAEVDVRAPQGLVPAVEYRLRAEPGRPTRARVACDAARCRAPLPAGVLAYRFGLLTPEGAFVMPTDELTPSQAPGAPVKVKRQSTPLYKKWWLWTVVGVVVVGGVVGAAIGGSASARASESIAISIRKDCGVAAVCPLWGAP